MGYPTRLSAVLLLAGCSNVDVIDDDGGVVSGSGGAGMSSTSGVVSSGVTASAASGMGGGTECNPGPDLCDGVDSDCDGSVDEDDPVSGTICETGQPGPCAMGVWSCETGFPSCIPNESPQPELCDMVDNDCNGPVDDGITCAPKRVFVTSQLFTGNLGALDGADASCQELADAAGLGGTYRAWLSSPDVDAADRHTHAQFPYVRVDGTVLADDWEDFVDGSLDFPISVNELGGPAPEGTACPEADPLGPRVWTGTLANGSLHAAGQTCFSWSSQGSTGTVGCAGANGETWSVCCSAPGCGATAALYCIEQ